MFITLLSCVKVTACDHACKNLHTSMHLTTSQPEGLQTSRSDAYLCHYLYCVISSRLLSLHGFTYDF